MHGLINAIIQYFYKLRKPFELYRVKFPEICKTLQL